LESDTVTLTTPGFVVAPVSVSWTFVGSIASGEATNSTLVAIETFEKRFDPNVQPPPAAIAEIVWGTAPQRIVAKLSDDSVIVARPKSRTRLKTVSVLVIKVLQTFPPGFPLLA
jgi:hypothetical protein